MAQCGLLIGATSSAAGKTTITLGILRALKRQGLDVASAKSGPDYIDPGFHQAATGRASLNLDAWAMPPDRLRQLASDAGGGLIVVEGAMGLFDGAHDGTGSAAELALHLGIPTILVMDVRKQGQTAAHIAKALASANPQLRIAGVILNRIGSPRHESLLRLAFERAGVPVLGALPSLDAVSFPVRHLGLVQAQELEGLERQLEQLADQIDSHTELEAIIKAATPLKQATAPPKRCPPLGRQIALARDAAFAFSYPHMIQDWQAQGCRIETFSPLADEGPPAHCDAVFLPGGYPELFASQLAAAGQFHQDMHKAKARGATIYGECGGFMALGQGLIDEQGNRHPMLGMLDVTTSFANRKRHLGYRELVDESGRHWRGHEFHYTSIDRQGQGTALWQARASGETRSSPSGLVSGNISGSFIHLIQPQ